MTPLTRTLTNSDFLLVPFTSADFKLSKSLHKKRVVVIAAFIVVNVLWLSPQALSLSSLRWILSCLWFRVCVCVCVWCVCVCGWFVLFGWLVGCMFFGCFFPPCFCLCFCLFLACLHYYCFIYYYLCLKNENESGLKKVLLSKKKSFSLILAIRAKMQYTRALQHCNTYIQKQQENWFYLSQLHFLHICLAIAHSTVPHPCIECMVFSPVSAYKWSSITQWAMCKIIIDITCWVVLLSFQLLRQYVFYVTGDY